MRLATRFRWTTTATWLSLCGLNSALVYMLVFLLPFQLHQYYTVPIPHFYNFQNASPALVALGWIVLFQLYYIAYRLCPSRPSRPVMTLVLLFPIFFSLVLFFMYPFGANDIFDQIFRGHTFAHLGVSPFDTKPQEFPNDPLLPYAWWKDTAGTYGPFWELINGLTARVVGTDLWNLVVSYKLLATLHMWASIAMSYAILRRIRPEFAVRGFLLFAWNPLVQFEMAGNSHLDAVLVFWMLLAIYLMIRQRHLLAMLALTAAILVKFLPGLLVPLFLAAIWQAHASKPVKERVKRLAVPLAGMGIMAALIFLPFGGPASTIAWVRELSAYFHSSVPWFVLHTFQTLGIGGANAQDWVRNIFSGFILIVALWYAVRVLRGGNDPTAIRENLLRGGYEILFAWLLLASQWFQPWYTTWLFAFMPLLPRFGYAERTILFGFTALSNYFIWFYRWPIGSPVAAEAEMMLFWTIFPIPILFSVGLWAYRRYQERGHLARPLVREDAPLAQQM